MSNILIVVTNTGEFKDKTPTGVYLEEFMVPFLRFKDKGFNVEIVSILGGNSPIDPSSIPKDIDESWKSNLYVLKNTKKLEDIDYSNFDAIFFPGGHGPMFDLAYYEPLCEILNYFNDKNKVIAAICHGVCALIPAINNYNIWLFNNKNLTSFTNEEEKLAQKVEMVPFLLETKLKQLGAKYQEYPPFAKHVVVDGKLITGQNQNSAELIADEIIKILD